jgi:hypothetical protein
MTTEPQDPHKVLAAVRGKSKLIVHLKDRRDRGDFKSVNDAISLQRAERERKKLSDELGPLRLVS